MRHDCSPSRSQPSARRPGKLATGMHLVPRAVRVGSQRRRSARVSARRARFTRQALPQGIRLNSSQDSMGENPNRWLEAQGLGAPLLWLEAFVSRAVRTRWDSSRARTNAIRLHWWRGLRSCEREARVYPGCGAAGGARAPPGQPLPTTGVIATTGPAAIRAGRAPDGQARLCQGSPGPARPLARAAAAGTRPKILTLCFRSISTRATLAARDLA